MDWTAGYASDIAYTAGFYRHLSPLHLNFVCALNGYEPVPLTRPYTYCELGMGRGLSLLCMAAANPDGHFVGIDFNPAHVAEARALAEEAQLSNIELIEASFEDCASGKLALPQFDFIVLHGIYTWVNHDNQAWIRTIMARHLRSGGIAFASYNALPGWTPTLPLQRILVEHAGLNAKRSDLQVKDAVAFIGRLEAAGARYMLANPAMQTRLQTLKTGDVHYLVHEYMHRHWAPVYHADVARAFSSEAKLDFVGQADLALAYLPLYLRPEQMAVVDEIADSALKETVKDYFQNTAFRQDVFVRGARELGAERHARCLADSAFALVVEQGKVSASMKLSMGTIEGRADLVQAFARALSDGPLTIAAMRERERERLGGEKIANLVQTAALQIMANALHTSHAAAPDAARKAPALRLNRVLARRAREDDVYRVLCSPYLGGALPSDLVERLAYDALVSAGRSLDAAALRSAVWQALTAQKLTLYKDGELLEGDEANQAEVARRVDHILEHVLPMWQQLHMM